MLRATIFVLLFLTSFCRAEEPAPIFSQQNLLAWCIVPFDAKKRGSEERAEMLARLNINKFAYDWRDEHIPTFDTEIDAMKAKKIEIMAWWFPGALNAQAQKILEVIKKHDIHPQLWMMMGDPKGVDQKEKVVNAANAVRPIAEAAAALGCKVGLYNHGRWFGEPQNQVAIIEELKAPNVGMVYNFHHGHAHVAKFAELFKLMQPHLLALNINGMSKQGDKQKILAVGAGEDELGLLKIVAASGWRGPVGILCHRTDIDAEIALRGNLEGLKKLTDANPELLSAK